MGSGSRHKSEERVRAAAGASVNPNILIISTHPLRVILGAKKIMPFKD